MYYKCVCRATSVCWPAAAWGTDNLCCRNFVNTSGQTPYCKFDSQILQLFVSVLYLAAGISAPIAGMTANRGGRKVSRTVKTNVKCCRSAQWHPCLQVCLMTSGFAFGAGLVLLAAAQDVAMVVIGR